MPELSDVETTRSSIARQIQGETIHALVVRQPQLRWPTPDDLAPDYQDTNTKKTALGRLGLDFQSLQISHLYIMLNCHFCFPSSVLHQNA